MFAENRVPPPGKLLEMRRAEVPVLEAAGRM